MYTTSYKKRPTVYNTGGYDDTKLREESIKFMKEALGLNMISNSNQYGIDLLNEEDNKWGAELEHAKNVVGDFFSKDNTKFNTKTNLGFATVNIPWWRKSKYWAPNNSGKDKNFFIRANSNYTQFIVVEASTFHNPEMCLESHFQTNYVTTGDVEEWRSFKREHVRVFNKINGTWVEDKIEVL
jgi:hypothetical protein